VFVFKALWFTASRFVVYMAMLGYVILGYFYVMGFMVNHRNVPEIYGLYWLLGCIFLIWVFWRFTVYNIRIIIRTIRGSAEFVQGEWTRR